MTTSMVQYDTAPAAVVVTDEQMTLIKRTVAKDATDAELQLYLYDCQRHGVHPLDKLLHFTKRGGKYTPITSIDLLRSRASDTGELAGLDDPQYQGEAGDPGFCASVTVWRIVQGQRCPFSASARWSEYKPQENDFMWRRMPYLMLGKCAEALALRKAFPRQLAGLYSQEEMAQAGNSGASYARPQNVDRATGEIFDAPDSQEARDEEAFTERLHQKKSTPARETNAASPLQEARQQLARLRNEALKAGHKWNPVKSPGDMSQLEVEAAISQLETLLNAKLAHAVPVPSEKAALVD